MLPDIPVYTFLLIKIMELLCCCFLRLLCALKILFRRLEIRTYYFVDGICGTINTGNSPAVIVSYDSI